MRELRLPAVKTVSYINLFTVSVCGSVRGLELIEWTVFKQLRHHISQECEDTPFTNLVLVLGLGLSCCFI